MHIIQLNDAIESTEEVGGGYLGQKKTHWHWASVNLRFTHVETHPRLNTTCSVLSLNDQVIECWRGVRPLSEVWPDITKAVLEHDIICEPLQPIENTPVDALTNQHM